MKNKYFKILILIIIIALSIVLYWQYESKNRYTIDKDVKIFLDQEDINFLESSVEKENAIKLNKTIKTLSPNLPIFNITNPTCAIVGNGANLINSNHGKDIDSHDYIFRMNNAPIIGYQTDVGNRTTFNVLHNWLKDIKVYDQNTITILNIFAFYNDKNEVKGDFNNLLIQFNESSINEFSQYAKMPKNITEFKNRLLITHPRFMSYIMSNWFLPPKMTRFYQKREWITPSTGFITLVIAFSICDKIDLYGFSSPDESGRWLHYFEQYQNPVPARHKADFQWQLLQELESKHLITINR